MKTALSSEEYLLLKNNEEYKVANCGECINFGGCPILWDFMKTHGNHHPNWCLEFKTERQEKLM